MLRKILHKSYRHFVSRWPVARIKKFEQVQVVFWASDPTHIREYLPIMHCLQKDIPVGCLTNKKDVFEYMKNQTQFPTGWLKYNGSRLDKTVRIFRKNIPALKFGIIGNDLREDDRLIGDTLHEMGLQYGIITHGMNELNTNLHLTNADHHFVWNPNEANRYQKQGVAQHKIHISGSPYFNTLLSKHTESTHKLTTGKKQILIASSGYGQLTSLERHKSHIQTLNTLAKELQTTHQFWVKLHRKDEPGLYVNAPYLTLTSSESGSNQVSPIVALIEKCDVLISGASNSAFEAMALGKPVIVYDTNPKIQNLEFISSDTVLWCKNEQELHTALLKLEKSEFYLSQTAKQYTFLKSYMVPQQVAPAELISNYITTNLSKTHT